MAEASNETHEEPVDSCIFPIDSYITGFRCVWTIEDYIKLEQELEQKKNILQMKCMLNISFDKTLSYSLFFGNGQDNGDKNNLYFGYFKKDTVIKDTWCVLKVSFLNRYNQCLLSNTLLPEDIINENIRWVGAVKFPELGDPLKYLVNGSLIILLEGAVSTKMNAGGGSSEVTELLQQQLGKLDTSLVQLKSKSKYSDVCFSVGDEQFELHKVILASKSEVFDKMFTDQNEIKNIIQLKDMKANVFSELVHFIYTNSVTHNFFNVALELLKAADVYKVQELKVLCERSLLNSVAIKNAATYFVAAHNHSAVELKKTSAEIIRENWDEVQNTEGWKELENNPQLFFHLMNLSFSKK